MPDCSLCSTAFISGEFPSSVCFAVMSGHTHKHWSAPACVITLPLKFSPLRPQHWGSWSRGAGSLNQAPSGEGNMCAGRIGGYCVVSQPCPTLPSQPDRHNAPCPMGLIDIRSRAHPSIFHLSNTFFSFPASNTNEDRCALGSKFLGAVFPTQVVESMQVLAPCPIFPKTARPLVSYCLSFSPKTFKNK